MYIWQQDNWPNFEYKTQQFDELLNQVVNLQARIKQLVQPLKQNDVNDLKKHSLVNNVLLSTHHEDEGVDLNAIEDCVDIFLNQSKASHTATSIENPLLIQMFSKVLDDLDQPITQGRLYQWHAILFANSDVDYAGELRTQSIHEKIHNRLKYIAPPKEDLTNQIQMFKHWFNQPIEDEKSGILRIAIAHFWLVTLHPFEDGNGRITRALTDRAIAQSEPQNIHLYSMTPAINANKVKYQTLLIQTQRCQLQLQQENPMDITLWVEWFLQNLLEQMQAILPEVEYLHAKGAFWVSHSQTVLTQRQVDVLNKITQNVDLFALGINASAYQDLTGVSKATATRDLSGLLNKGCLKKLDRGGRSTRYRLNY